MSRAELEVTLSKILEIKSALSAQAMHQAHVNGASRIALSEALALQAKTRQEFEKAKSTIAQDEPRLREALMEREAILARLQSSPRAPAATRDNEITAIILSNKQDKLSEYERYLSQGEVNITQLAAVIEESQKKTESLSRELVELRNLESTIRGLLAIQEARSNVVSIAGSPNILCASPRQAAAETVAPTAASDLPAENGNGMKA